MTTHSNVLKHYWLYVLKLEQQKFYVGITSRTPEIRMEQHLSGFAGAQWTKFVIPKSCLS